MQAPSSLADPRDIFRCFVSDVAALRATQSDDHLLAATVARRLAPLLLDGAWLGSEQREPAADHYRQHLLYVAPDGAFSVVSLVWLPGQSTPIHDHVAWCVVGVLEGQEAETRYRLYQDERGQFLTESSRHRACPGQAVALVPPDEDIHRVTNAGQTQAISIHIYGANIEALGSSINRRFDDLPLHATPGQAVPLRWRDRP